MLGEIHVPGVAALTESVTDEITTLPAASVSTPPGRMNPFFTTEHFRPSDEPNISFAIRVPNLEIIR